MSLSYPGPPGHFWLSSDLLSRFFKPFRFQICTRQTRPVQSPRDKAHELEATSSNTSQLSILQTNRQRTHYELQVSSSSTPIVDPSEAIRRLGGISMTIQTRESLQRWISHEKNGKAHRGGYPEGIRSPLEEALENKQFT